jgi:Ser/Thr protein kinase RdoA (MazF antagonist)
MPIHWNLLDSIARLYGVSPARLQPVAGGHFSHVYETMDDQRACILRITPPNADVDLVSMQATLEWLAYLSAQDGPVPRPVRSRKKDLIELVEYEGQVYIATAIEKAPGALAEGMAPDEWSDELFQALGRSLGQCHRAAQSYVLARPEFKRPEWDRAGSCFNPRDELADADPAVLEKRDQVLSLVQSLPKDRDSYGLASCEPGPALWEGRRCGAGTDLPLRFR